MSFDASVPKALYQANIDLALRIAALLQESGAQWFELFGAEANARLAEAAGEAYRSGHDVPSAVASPLQSDVILKWAQSNPARLQALLMQAASQQSRFSEGLQAALQRWQAACGEAFQSVVGPLPNLTSGPAALPGWQQMTDMVQGLMAPFVPAFQPAARKAAQPERASAPDKDTPRPASKTAPTTKPAPKPAAKAASKPASKPAAKAATKPASKPAAKTAKKSATKPVTKATDKTASAGASKMAPASGGKKVPKPAPATITRSRSSPKPEA